MSDQQSSVNFKDLVDIDPSSTDEGVPASELVDAQVQPKYPGPQAPKVAYFAGGLGKAATLLPSLAGMVGTGFETIGDLAFPKEPITLKKGRKAWIRP